MYVMHACMHGWMDGWMDGCMYVCIYVCIYVSICVGVLNTTRMSYHVLLIDLLYIKDALMPAVTCKFRISGGINQDVRRFTSQK